MTAIYAFVLNASMLSVCLPVQVSLPVVRRFVKSVSEKAIGMGVVRGVRPDQQLVKVCSVPYS